MIGDDLIGGDLIGDDLIGDELIGEDSNEDNSIGNDLNVVVDGEDVLFEDSIEKDGLNVEVSISDGATV